MSYLVHASHAPGRVPLLHESFVVSVGARASHKEIPFGPLAGNSRSNPSSLCLDYCKRPGLLPRSASRSNRDLLPRVPTGPTGTRHPRDGSNVATRHARKDKRVAAVPLPRPKKREIRAIGTGSERGLLWTPSMTIGDLLISKPELPGGATQASNADEDLEARGCRVLEMGDGALPKWPHWPAASLRPTKRHRRPVGGLYP